jgi:hypothetical protein
MPRKYIPVARKINQKTLRVPKETSARWKAGRPAAMEHQKQMKKWKDYDLNPKNEHDCGFCQMTVKSRARYWRKYFIPIPDDRDNRIPRKIVLKKKNDGFTEGEIAFVDARVVSYEPRRPISTLF